MFMSHNQNIFVFHDLHVETLAVAITHASVQLSRLICLSASRLFPHQRSSEATDHERAPATWRQYCLVYVYQTVTTGQQI